MKQNSSRYIIGLVLILFGILFIFKNFNVPFLGQIDVFQFVIPLILYYWAYRSYLKGKNVGAMILGLIGTSILFDSIGWDFLGFSLLEKLLVPGIFILIGYSILNKNTLTKTRTGTSQSTNVQSVTGQYYTSGSSGAEVLKDPIIMEDNTTQPNLGDAVSSGPNLNDKSTTANQGPLNQRQLTTVFSSQRMYFTKADFLPGNSYIDATCVFGDLDLIFSKDVHLHIDANVTMADLNFIGHKFGGLMNKFQENYFAGDSDVHVYLSLSAVFGDVDILHSK